MNSTSSLSCLQELMLLLLREAFKSGAALVMRHETAQAAFEELCRKGLRDEAERIMAKYGCEPDEEPQLSPRFAALVELQLRHAAGFGVALVTVHDNEAALCDELRGNGMGKEVDRILAEYADTEDITRCPLLLAKAASGGVSAI